MRNLAAQRLNGKSDLQASSLDVEAHYGLYDLQASVHCIKVKIVA